MKKKTAYILAVCLLAAAGALSLAACGAKAPFSGTVYVDYITPEDSIYEDEQTLEGAAARLIRDAYDGVVDGVISADAPDVNVDLRRRESFGRVKGEPKADAELVLAPKMDPGSGEVDMEALVRDIALCVGKAKGVDSSIISAIGGGGQAANSTSAVTTADATNATETEAVPGTATAAKPTTTTKKLEDAPNKQEMYPQELHLASNQIVNYSDTGISGKNFGVYADSGFNLAFPANGKTYLFSRAAPYNKRDYFEKQFKAGTVETIAIYVKTGQQDGKTVFQRIGTYDYTVEVPAGSVPGYVVYIIPDRNETMLFPGNSTQSYKSVSVSVGRNIGVPFSYWADDEIYVNPSDFRTIMLN